MRKLLVVALAVVGMACSDATGPAPNSLKQCKPSLKPPLCTTLVAFDSIHQDTLIRIRKGVHR
jgi:hypothetical protein